MKVAVVSYHKKIILNELKKQGIKLVSKNPDIVIAYGGEGTFIYSEQLYPGIPKFFVGHPRLSKNPGKRIGKYIKKLKEKKYTIEKAIKIEAKVRGKKLIGLNDINIHYRPPTALRYNVFVSNKKINGEIIGDGVIISTPWGSSAYYKSITRKTFSKGLGIAFNNPCDKMKPIITRENSTIKVKILRGESVMVCDCNKKIIPLKKNDIITIKKHSNPAKVIKLKGEKVKVRL